MNTGALSKGGEGALMGAGLVLYGTLAGKTAGIAAAKGVASTTKLATPFVGKAITAVTSALGAGAAGGALAGPAGAALGATGAVGVDWLVNEGVSLMTRKSMEAEVQETLQTTQQDLESRVVRELRRVVNTYVDDSVQLLVAELGESQRLLNQ